MEPHIPTSVYTKTRYEERISVQYCHNSLCMMTTGNSPGRLGLELYVPFTPEKQKSRIQSIAHNFSNDNLSHMQQIEGGAPLPSQSYKAPICSECWKDVGMVSQK